MANKSLCSERFFNEFYVTHIQAASNFAYYKSGDQSASLDLAQEGFIKVWENCSKIDILKAKSYLFTVINNLFLNTIKHQKVVFTYAKNSPYLDVDNQSPEYLLEEEEFKDKLKSAIQELSEKERSVFLMHRIDGKKYKEIAGILEISQKAVEKRMSAALKKLRIKIDGI
jgi:RNA polymerase sigma-70 factor (ECF subfamily)